MLLTLKCQLSYKSPIKEFRHQLWFSLQGNPSFYYSLMNTVYIFYCSDNKRSIYLSVCLSKHKTQKLVFLCRIQKLISPAHICRFASQGFPSTHQKKLPIALVSSYKIFSHCLCIFILSPVMSVGQYM